MRIFGREVVPQLHTAVERSFGVGEALLRDADGGERLQGFGGAGRGEEGFGDEGFAFGFGVGFPTTSQ